MRKGPFILGPKGPSTGDVYLFCAFGFWGAGLLRGVSLERLLGGRPKLASLMEHVGGLPKVRRYYAEKDLAGTMGNERFWENYLQFAKL